MKRKACKKCKIFTTANECPVCKGTDFATSFYGRMHFINVNKSMIAEKINVKANGEYAIKLR